MPQSFGILIFPEAEELDFVGPWELTLWSKHAQAPAYLRRSPE